MIEIIKNDDFLDLHIDKIENKLKAKLELKIRDTSILDIERKALKVIKRFLNKILKADTKMLEDIVKKYDEYIEKNKGKITIISFEIFGTNELKEFCRNNNIAGYSNKPKLCNRNSILP
jgi:pimeloyl-CoA synthetase